MANKYAGIESLRIFLENIKTTFAALSHKHTVSDLTDYAVDNALSSTSVNPVQNKVIDAEFEAVSTAMNALETSIDGKANTVHNHDELYYTETEVDTKLSSKSDTSHNHDSLYDKKGAASDSLTSANEYTNQKTSGLASTSFVNTSISTHNTSTASHNDIRDLITGLTTRLNTLANSDDTTLDQMSEIVAYIKNNKSLIDGITTSKVNVSDIINNLATNVTNKPLSAAQGVAISGLISALESELDTHDTNTTKHITATERTNWGTAYTHSQAAHAPSNAEKNQNAFSNIAVSGQTTVAADTTTDTITFAGSNVTITTDANNDKVTFTVADGSTSAKGVVQLTNSTSSTSTTTAATPNSVKSAYDLANTAKTNAATAQTRADNAYTLAESKLSSSALANYYTKTEIDNLELITIADIDAICGASIQYATLSEVTF